MAIIPKPPKKVNHSEDKRKKYLDEWKGLFLAIHPEITAIHYYEEGFTVSLYDEEKIREGVEFGAQFYENARLLVFLPKELNMEYIVGLIDDEMFSKDEVMQDTFYWDKGPSFDHCQPETFKWIGMYDALCSRCENVKNEIVKPPLDEIKQAKIAQAILAGDEYDRDGYKGCPACGSRSILHSSSDLDNTSIRCCDCHFSISGGDGYQTLSEWNEIDRTSKPIEDEVEL